MNDTINIILTPDRVSETFRTCLFKDGEETHSAVIADGITVKVGFHPERLEAQRETVRSMLDELPSEFHQNGGGGWSFLNMCNDKHDRQWTGFHVTMEELCLLGIALDLVEFTMPREMWKILPGGVPYFMIKAPQE